MMKFEIGKTYSCCGLYGGEYVITVTDRTDKTINFVYSERTSDDRSVQTAEIILQDCSIYDHELNVIDTVKVETAIAWDYQPRGYYGEPLGDIDHGYYFALSTEKLWTVEEWEKFKKEKEEDNEMMKFELIAEQVKEDAEKRKAETAEIIEKGYLSTWSTEHHEQNDNGLKRESTATRWKQYTSGKITRAEAVELATKRAYKAIDKETAEKLAKLERVANAPDLEYISICVEWKRSATWGMNPTAYVNTNSERTSGHASGCGYDKESAAIAEALNQCDSVLKALYSFKEKQMREGQNDHSRTACTGHDNRNIIGYGAGYSTMPYFEGGVGASCFWSIFERLGYTCRGNHSGKNSDYYHIEKKTA